MGRVELARAVISFGQEQLVLPRDDPRHELLRLSTEEREAAAIKRELLPTTVGSSLFALLGIGDVSGPVRGYYGCGDGSTKINSLTPGIDLSRAARKVFAEFVLHHLKKSTRFRPRDGRDANTLCRHLDDTAFSSLKECFDGISDHLGLSQEIAIREVAQETVPEQSGPSWIEPSVWTYVKQNERGPLPLPSHEFDPVIDETLDVIDYLGERSSSRRPIAILRGPAHFGKKAIVGDMLRRFDAAGDMTFTCRGRSGDEVVLPIFCIQTTQHDYVSSCVATLTYLERLDGHTASNERLDAQVRSRLSEMSRVGTEPNVGLILERIGELHQNNPALFVFLDVGQPPGDLNSLLHQTGYERLLATLLESNDSSRFIVTTGGRIALANKKTARKIDVPRPTGDRLKWYLGPTEQQKFDVACQENPADDVLQSEIDGDVLTVLAVLLAETPDSEMPSFLDLMRDCSSSADATGTSLRLACEELMVRWRARSMLPIVALIVASADGMMLPTVTTCLDQWRKSGRDEAAQRIPSDTDAVAFLGQLSKTAKGQFLRRRPMPEHFIKEARFDEIRRIESGDKQAFATYIFSHDIGVVLRAILLEDATGLALLRQAYRMVGRQAHLRARNRQMKSSDPARGPMQRPPERAIQAFTALLLSIDRFPDTALSSASELDQRVNTDWPSISHKSDLVFSLDSSVFDPALAIRFAFSVLLQFEADRDHRLSMSIDADIYRLALYARLFVEPGLREGWYVGRDDLVPSEGGKRNLGALPKGFEAALPRHLRVFSTSERAVMLESLGMSAFFVGHRPLLVWAEQRLWEEYQRLRSGNSPDGEVSNGSISAALERVVSARLDLEMQIGHPLNGGSMDAISSTDLQLDRIGRIDQRRSLKQVFKRLNRDIAAIMTAPGRAEAASAQAAPAPLSLMLRRQRLLWLLEGADDLADGLAQLEEADRKAWTGRSPIAQGRSGWILMTLLLDGFPILRSFDRDSIELWTEHRDRYLAFVQANTARLYRFSGAERLQTVTDHALALAMDREFEDARRAIAEARRMCQNSSATGRTRLGVLQAEIAILVTALEDTGSLGTAISSDREAQLKQLHKSLEDGERICRRYDLRVEEIRMALLRLRASRALGVQGAMIKAIAAPDLPQFIRDACKKTAANGLLRFVPS